MGDGLGELLLVGLVGGGGWDSVVVVFTGLVEEVGGLRTGSKVRGFVGGACAHDCEKEMGAQCIKELYLYIETSGKYVW